MQRGCHTRKRILVTWGAGFIGSHLCERLLSDGHDILCVANFYTGTRDNIAHLLDHPHFELLRHDITFPLFVEVDEIYNLACPASPVHYQNDPVQTTKTSVHGSINLLELAKRVRAKILLASTSGVYGDPVFHLLPEDNPRQRCPDITLARKIMKWQPSIALDTGLERTIGYFRNQFQFTTD